MSCRSSWYTRDIDLGSVIGYRAKKDVRSGLFVDLLNGDSCYDPGKLIYVSIPTDESFQIVKEKAIQKQT